MADAEGRGEFVVHKPAERFIRQARQLGASVAADEAADEHVAFRRASWQHRGREEATEYIATFAARRQVAETVERMRDVFARVTAGDDRHRRDLAVFPVSQVRRDRFIEGQGAPVPEGGRDDEVFGGNAVFGAVGAAPGDVPPACVASERGRHRAETEIFRRDTRSHRIGQLLHASGETDDGAFRLRPAA